MTETNNKKKIFAAVSAAAAILLAAAAVFLFAANGIRSADLTRFPVPEQYYNVCLSPGGMLSEQFRAPAAVLLAVLIRLPLVGLESGDYTGYLLPWIEHYQRWGIVDGLASLPGNYYVHYNLFLALISKLSVPPYWPIAAIGFAGDLLLASYGARIARFLGEKNGLADASIRVHTAVTFFALILLPPVFLDSAAWKQADTIYIGFLAAAVYYALKDRYFAAFIMLGISFMFKLQAVFLLPFLIILYFCRRFRLAYFLIPPAFYLLGGLPAILCGGEPRYIYMRYMSQTSDAPVMTSMFPNVYNFGLYGYDWLKVPSILFTLFCFVALFLICVRHAEAMDSARTLQLAALCIWICVMFLPSMHQRYGLGVAVFLVIAFLSDVRNRTLAVITVTAVLVETMVFAGYLFAYNDGVPLLVQSFLYVGIFFVYAWNFITGLTASKGGEAA